MNQNGRPPLRLILIGWGAIARHVADLLSARSAGVAIVGVAVRDPAKARDLPGAPPRLITAPADLAAFAPDLVVEAAGRDAVAAWGVAALAAAPALVIASTSALVDENLLRTLVEAAEHHGSRILLPAGALGGIDALAAAATAGLSSVRHTVVKPPAAWRGTHADTLIDLATLLAPRAFYRGSAREAARLFPQNANATVMTALAGLGLDRTEVELVADPAATRNGHRIVAEGDFGSLRVELDNHPLPTNPKSSALTALSLVRLIENRSAALVV